MKTVLVLCELCESSAAKAYCESDRARLCWECDAKVHGANFLVAKHSRALLCHLCHTPTPWRASGPILPRASMSFCLSCCRHLFADHQQHSTHQELTDHLDDINEDGDEDDNDEDEEEEKENQVVPWRSGASSSEPVEEKDDDFDRILSTKNLQSNQKMSFLSSCSYIARDLGSST
uniref:B box-type domain-containing protein n=2 Tax=Opuntia streptacantha TaxID=393608 RepID=A0A7C9D1V4_OPUST